MPGVNRPSKKNRDHLRMVAFNEKKKGQRPCLCPTRHAPLGAECMSCGGEIVKNDETFKVREVT